MPTTKLTIVFLDVVLFVNIRPNIMSYLSKKIIAVFLLIVWFFVSWPKLPMEYSFPPETPSIKAASPSVTSRGNGNANATTLTVTLTGTPASGDLYIVFLQSKSNGNTWTQNTGTTGWTEMYDTNGQSVWYKQIGTSEPNPTFLQSSSARAGYSILQITGHENPTTQAPEVSAEATQTTTTPDPPSITPTGGSKDYLFIAFAGTITTSNNTFTAAPTNYANLNIFNTGAGPNGNVGATAERQLTASSEDPGTFTLGGSQTWYARTIAVHPVSASVAISLDTDGSVSFGHQPLDTTQDTTASGINDTETIRVDTGPADLDVRSTAFSDGSNTWSLSTANGSNQVLWEFSPNGSAWTTFAVANTLYSLATNVSQGSTQNIFFRLTMPTTTSSYNQHSTTVTIQASVP